MILDNKCTLELRTSIADGATYDPDTSLSPRCPQCGESYYMENFCTTTAVYFPPVYKDGVNINPDRNITTAHCTCMNCGTEFSVKK